MTMARATSKELRTAFHAYCTAYARAGLGTDIWVRESDSYYRSTALDLVLTEPNAYRGGQISVEPFNNPLHPQRWGGASGSNSPAGLQLLGDTKAEALRSLRAATTALYAAVQARGASTAPHDVEAYEFLSNDPA